MLLNKVTDLYNVKLCKCMCKDNMQFYFQTQTAITFFDAAL